MQTPDADLTLVDHVARRGGPSVAHEERRDLLGTLAILAGYTRDLPLPLPDGSMPDVMKVDPDDGSVFIGEAKHTERPSRLETRRRLMKYLAWFSLFDQTATQRSIMAVCFGDSRDAGSWESALRSLARKVGIVHHRVGLKSLAADAHVVWLYDERSIPN